MERDVHGPKDWRVDMLVKERQAEVKAPTMPERRSHPSHFLSFLETPPSLVSHLEEAAGRWLDAKNEASACRFVEEGLLLDVHGTVLGVAQAGDVFRGMLVVLYTAAQVVQSLNQPPYRRHEGLLCNLALQCYPGIMLAQGHASYGKFLREWPDPVTYSTNELMAEFLLPLVSAWISGSAFFFLDPAASIDEDAVKQVVLARGEGAEMLFACSLNFGSVYLLWRPCSSLLQSMQGHRWWHDGFALALAFSPLALMFCAKMLHQEGKMMQTLPYLLHYHVGILLAASWDRFLSELRPWGAQTVTDSIHVLPWEVFYAWARRVAAAWWLAFIVFMPLAQVALVEDLTTQQVSTPFGSLGSPHVSFPSPLWVVALLWPLGVTLVISGLLVAAQRYSVLRWIGQGLSHVGRNFLYYMVVVNIFLASQRHQPHKVGLAKCLLGAASVLATCRFIHCMAGLSRKAVRI